MREIWCKKGLLLGKLYSSGRYSRCWGGFGSVCYP